MGSIFNILGCTAALLGHFAANSTIHDKYRQLHRLLLNSLRDAPRQIRLHSLGHVEGHCYGFRIDDDLPNDRDAASTIILFEDGKSLPRPHFRDPRKIADEGRGAYQHFDRVILFSTTDNTSPLVNGRKYAAVHSLSAVPAIFDRLVNWKKTTKATGAARLFDMLQVWSAEHFSYAAMSGDGADVSLSGVRLSIDQGARMQLTARTLSVRAVADRGTQWDFAVTALAAADAPDTHWDLSGRIDLSPDAASILVFLKLDGSGGVSLSCDCDSRGTIAVKLGGLQAIRPAMLAWFGNEAALNDWMAGLVRLATAPLSASGFGLSLDQNDSNILAQMLSGSGVEQRYELTIDTAQGQRQARLRRVAHDH